MRYLLLSGIAVLASAFPALAQSSGLGSSGLGSSGLGSSSLGGTSFLGGTSGGGSSGGFLGTGGGMGSSGSGSFLGATSGTNTNSNRNGTSGTQAVGSTTFLGPYFGNPLSLGIANSTANTNGTPTFGVPLYTITGTGSSTNSTYGGLAGASGTSGSAITATSTTSGSSMGVRRAPAYVTSLGFTARPEAPTRVQGELQQLFARSERLASRDNIRVDVEGPTVVLRGTVVDEHERRLAEALARLTPGVHDLRNELGVRGATAATGP